MKDKTMIEYARLVGAVSDAISIGDCMVSVDTKTLDKLLYKFKALVDFVEDAKKLVNEL